MAETPPHGEKYPFCSSSSTHGLRQIQGLQSAGSSSISPGNYPLCFAAPSISPGLPPHFAQRRNWRELYQLWLQVRYLTEFLNSLSAGEIIHYIAWDVFRHFGNNVLAELQQLAQASDSQQVRKFCSAYLRCDLNGRKSLLDEFGVLLKYRFSLYSFDLLVSYRLDSRTWQLFPGLSSYAANAESFDLSAILLFASNSAFSETSTQFQAQEVALIRLARAAILEQLLLQNFALPSLDELGVAIMPARGLNANVTNIKVTPAILTEGSSPFERTLQISLPACYVVDILQLQRHCVAYWIVLYAQWQVKNSALLPGWKTLVNQPDPVILNNLLN